MTLARKQHIGRNLILGYIIVALSVSLAAWLSVNRIESEVHKVADTHDRALRATQSIEKLAYNSAQELFAFFLSGHEEELAEFRIYSEQLSKELIQYASIARLAEPEAEDKLLQFDLFRQSLSKYQIAANRAVDEFALQGRLSDAVFKDIEENLDTFGQNLSVLVELETTDVVASRASRDVIIAQSESLLVAVAATGIIVISLIGWLVTRQVTAYLSELVEQDEALLLQRNALESMGLGICFARAEGDQEIIYANQGLVDMTGFSQAELLGSNCRMLQGEDTAQSAIDALHRAVRNQAPINQQLLNYRKNGEAFQNDLYISPVRDQEGKVTHFVGVMQDVSEKLTLLEQLRRAQKMESIGQLAGGIAHDFNNYLTVINGHAETLSTSTYQPDEVARKAGEIYKAGERAASLTAQLLAFSRRQVLVPQILDLNVVIREMDDLFRRTLGGQISLETVSAGGLGLVSADRSQLEQVLLNLVINARDAMPQGGSITIETGNVYLDAEYVRQHQDAHEGQAVMLAVSDTGSGIPVELQERIFEPFFTTKESGGNGLGLSTVIGIVEQSGGHIRVYTEPESGAAFKIYLPRVRGEVETRSSGEDAPVKNLTGKILVVEDEAMVREITCQMARDIGLQVLEAASGDAGLDILENSGEDIDLLLTDVMLPGINGRELGEASAKLFPDIAILYMSGYTENGILHHGRLDEGISFLQKPFTRAELARKLALALERAKLKS